MISKVLVANRGEIARRIFRTCREMGISTVAIHSHADAGEPHVREADEAHALRGEKSSETYLNIDAILAAAKHTSADAIHPGYGFLAENADFARAVVDAGLTWIGPPAAAIEVMGSKIKSKELMESAGVPILPGAPLSGLSAVVSTATSIGFPIVIKASAGGGGKGMRVVDNPDDLLAAMESAKREAAGAFGDDTLLMEKYLTAPRHIEIQVFADTHGNVVSLHERECSVQRRHQKIIEEAPSVAIDHGMRSDMGKTAVIAAEAVGYVGAGTVEFLFQDDKFYFLEMNTRLQVEHPVTEMVTGLDLVRMQIEVANGGATLTHAPILEGHAIEARLYAEDPLNDFLPVSGRFHEFAFADVPGLRVDSGVEAGSSVSVHYDPLIAKVIAYAPTRDAAASILATALRKAHIHGSTTNRALLVRILEHADFLDGETDTHFLVRNDPAELGRPLADERTERLAAVATALADQAHERARATTMPTIPSGWRNVAGSFQHRAYQGQHARYEINYSTSAPFEVEGLGMVAAGRVSSDSAVVELDGTEYHFAVARYQTLRYADSPEGPVMLEEVPRFPISTPEDAPGSLHAPMPGKVVRVGVAQGDQVGDGDVLVVMEAMKMEHTLRSPHAGTVSQVLCEPGDQVESGVVLVVVA